MVDWSAGSYESTAAELAPVAEAVVARSGVGAGDDVVDVACGTGNAALAAAARGARVVGIDGAPRLLSVAGERAVELGLDVEWREGDLEALPAEDGTADVVLSVFGVIFAREPASALAEIARVLRPGGRALISAWVPAGPLHEMLEVVGRAMEQIAASPRPRFAWSDTEVLAPVARSAGLEPGATERSELAVRAASPEAYVDAGRNHPMAVASLPALQRAGADEATREGMVRVLQDANEDPSGFLIHSPYVIHELRRGTA
jgi:SAM-dependent methyltransferase